ncbi:hypothetical protein CDD83_2236 [Cordyceps sp. RAO-2017]|nr:hypothetical protein CDD83_2236 [Cordyceps sp. RAO-2017]
MMADPFSIIGVIGVALQIVQEIAKLGLSWKDAPKNVRKFMAELQALKSTLSETNLNLALNPEFVLAFQGRRSAVLSQWKTETAANDTDKKVLTCKAELDGLLGELKKRANMKGQRAAWDRVKAAFLSDKTRQAVEDLHRQCQTLNSLAAIDSAALGAYTLNEFKTARQEHLDQERARQQSLVLDWLSSVDHGVVQYDCGLRQQSGTGQWFLDALEFRTWVKSCGETLFCPGIPGAGKTILTSIIIDELRNQFHGDQDTGLAYIYCNFKLQHAQTATHLLASLLKQLAQQRPCLPEGVQALYNKHAHGARQGRPSHEDVSRTLHETVSMYKRVFIVIDALDECSKIDGCREKLVSELVELQRRGCANLLVTSRPLLEINRFFESSTKVEIRAAGEDVRAYLEGQMSQSTGPLRRNCELQEEVVTGIEDAVDGMFLLAKLHLDGLRGKVSPKAVRTALLKLPTGSDAYDLSYHDAMERIESQLTDQANLAKRVISWIAYSKRPLTTEELQHALAVEIGQHELDEDNIADIEDIVSACAGLVTVEQESSVIRLVHYTTQEYFERSGHKWFPEARGDIAQTCLTYLSFSAFQNGACRKGGEFEARLRHHKLYDYAACHWGHHARDADTSVQTIAGFLESEGRFEASSQALVFKGRSMRNPSGSFGCTTQVTGLHAAAYFGLDSLALFLVKDGEADPRDSDGETPLVWAITKGQETSARLLIQQGADLEATNHRWSQTPLHLAVIFESENCIKTLVQLGADLEAKDRYGQTPLHLAVISESAICIEILVQLGAHLEAKNWKSRTPLHLAVTSESEICIDTLARRGANLEARDRYGKTPLHLATCSGAESSIKVLAQLGADLEAKDEDGYTPLHQAANYNLEGSVNALIQSGADLETEARCGQTPLHVAARIGNEDSVHRLLMDKASIDSRDFCGRTSLISAAAYGHKSIVRRLLSGGCAVNVRDLYGQTALSLAARHGHEGVVQLLLFTVPLIEMDSKDAFGRSPLWWSTRNSHISTSTSFHEIAVRRGVTLWEEDITETSKHKVSGSGELWVYCDVCLSPVLTSSQRDSRYCTVCLGGDFDICPECLSFGARCLDASHILTRRECYLARITTNVTSKKGRRAIA